MSIYIASLVKIPCYLFKLSPRNENIGMSRADNSINIRRNLPINNPKPDLVCVEVLQPSQPNGVMSSAVSLPNHTFTGQA